jgi:PAS domain S-box-containing protein
LKSKAASEKGDFDDPIQFTHLRQKAVNELKNRQIDRSNLNEDEAKRLFYELQIKQIELQMQSEELHMAQLALEESRNRYQDLYNNAPVGYFTIHENGLIIDTNRTGVKLIGIDRSRLKNKFFSSFILEEDRDKYLLHRQKVYQNQGPDSCELRITNRDGEHFFAQLKSTLVKDASKSMHVIVTDITEQKYAEEALLFSKKIVELGTLTDGIAHEINSPLQIVIGMSERILRQVASGSLNIDQLKQNAELIQNTGWRIAEIIQMLHNSVSAYRNDMEAVDLNDTMDACLKPQENKNKDWSKIKFIRHYASNMPPLYCSRSGIIQVMTNLLNNAYDAMPGGGEITIETSHWPKKEQFIIKVIDTGHGMPPEIQDRIFDPFFTTREQGNGIGMGLSIVMGIIKMHGGTIMVDSLPGKGSTFTITLPAKPPMETLNKLSARFTDF